MMVGGDHDVEMWCPAAVLGEIVDDVLHRFRYRPRRALRMDTAVDQHPPCLIAPAHRDPEGVAETDVVHPYFDVYRPPSPPP